MNLSPVKNIRSSIYLQKHGFANEEPKKGFSFTKKFPPESRTSPPGRKTGILEKTKSAKDLNCSEPDSILLFFGDVQMIHHILSPDHAGYGFCKIAVAKNHAEFENPGRKRRNV